MPSDCERLIKKITPLGVSAFLVLGLCGLALPVPTSRAESVPGQTTNISSDIAQYEDSLISSEVFDTGAQTYHASANLKIPPDLTNLKIGHPRKIIIDINQKEVTLNTNGLLWMPVLNKDNDTEMNIHGTYGTGEHAVNITTIEPITADTSYTLTGTIISRNSVPSKICAMGLRPPWLCFTFNYPRYSWIVNFIVHGVLLPTEVTSGNAGSNTLFSLTDDTWGGPNIKAFPTSSQTLYIDNGVGYLAFQQESPVRFEVVSPTAPVTLTADAVHMDMYATVGPPCSDIIVYTAASALDPASNTHMVLPVGTPQELSVSGATLKVLSPAERTSTGGIASNWGEQWILSPLSGASSIAITSTMKYPCPTCLTEARLDLPGCHKTFFPMILR